MSKQIDTPEFALRDAHHGLMTMYIVVQDMVLACADIDRAGY